MNVLDDIDKNEEIVIAALHKSLKKHNKADRYSTSERSPPLVQRAVEPVRAVTTLAVSRDESYRVQVIDYPIELGDVWVIGYAVSSEQGLTQSTSFDQKNLICHQSLGRHL